MKIDIVHMHENMPYYKAYILTLNAYDISPDSGDERYRAIELSHRYFPTYQAMRDWEEKNPILPFDVETVNGRKIFLSYSNAHGATMIPEKHYKTMISEGSFLFEMQRLNLKAA